MFKFVLWSVCLLYKYSQNLRRRLLVLNSWKRGGKFSCQNAYCPLLASLPICHPVVEKICMTGFICKRNGIRFTCWISFVSFWGVWVMPAFAVPFFEWGWVPTSKHVMFIDVQWRLGQVIYNLDFAYIIRLWSLLNDLFCGFYVDKDCSGTITILVRKKLKETRGSNYPFPFNLLCQLAFKRS